MGNKQQIDTCGYRCFLKAATHTLHVSPRNYSFVACCNLIQTNLLWEHTSLALYVLIEVVKGRLGDSCHLSSCIPKT